MAPGLLGLSAGPGSTRPPEHAHMSGPPAHPGTRLPGPHHPLRLPSPNSGHPAEQWAPGRGLSAAFQGWRPAPGGSRRLPVAAPLRASLRVPGPAPAGPCVAGVCPSSLTATLSGKCAPAPAHPRTLHPHTCARPGTLHLHTHTPGCGWTPCVWNSWEPTPRQCQATPQVSWEFLGLVRGHWPCLWGLGFAEGVSLGAFSQTELEAFTPGTPMLLPNVSLLVAKGPALAAVALTCWPGVVRGGRASWITRGGIRMGLSVGPYLAQWLGTPRAQRGMIGETLWDFWGIGPGEELAASSEFCSGPL